MAPWPRAPVIPQLVDRKTFRDNRWVRHLSLTSCGVDDLVQAGFPTRDGKSRRSVTYPSVTFIQVHSSAKCANRSYHFKNLADN
ncbi:hypothetical protein TNCV_3593481 [Trichonephila clavipes]|nr:hypothetical protein TNCV_3593481 [Trichonephila clavipes]